MMAIWDGEEQMEFVNVAPMLTIPKRFHLIWNHSELPAVYRDHGAMLRSLHPDWEFQYWDDERIKLWMDMIRDTEMDFLVELLDHAYANVKDKRQVSDLARLGLIYMYGGVYLDFDYTPLKNFEPLLCGPCVLTCPSPRNIANGFIAAGRGDEFIRFCLDYLPEAYYSLRQGATHKTGPRFMTQMYRDFLDETGSPGAKLLEQKLFYPYTYNRLDLERDYFPEAYAIHRWASKKGDVWMPETETT